MKSPRCFTMWMAGGSVKPGLVLGETDDYCYKPVPYLPFERAHRIGVNVRES